MLVLGDAGLRCEELAGLERRDFLPARKGAKLRALEVRHGKGDRAAARQAQRARDRARSCAGTANAPARSAPPADDAPLFITLGRRRRDGSYTRVGRRCGQPVLAAVIKRLGAPPRSPPELCHPHALRHTCATELLRTGANIADVRTILGHASVKTTSIYLASDDSAKRTSSRAATADARSLDDDRDRA